MTTTFPSQSLSSSWWLGPARHYSFVLSLSQATQVLRVCHRLSLDRAKFYTSYARSAGVSTGLRESLLASRLREAEHRERVVRLRQSLTRRGTRPPSPGEAARLLEDLISLVQESDTLTQTLRPFLSSARQEPRLTWLASLMKRIPWFSSLIEDC